MTDQDIEPAAQAGIERVAPVIDPGLPPEARDRLAHKVGQAENGSDTPAGCGLMLSIAGAITLFILHFAAGVGWWWMLVSGLPVTIGIVVTSALGGRLEDGDAGHVIRDADLDGPSRKLMLRTQKAIRAILEPREYAKDSLGDTVPEVALRRHEWDIATSLREISKLRASHKGSGADDAPGPMTAAVLESQHRALALATDSVAARIGKLERCAAEFELADAADRDWRAAMKASGSNDQYLDLVARTAADEHAIAEIRGLTEQASAAVQVFREHLYQASLAARALALPPDPLPSGPPSPDPPSPGPGDGSGQAASPR